MENLIPGLLAIAALWWVGYKLTRPRARAARKIADPGCPYCRGSGRVLDYDRQMKVMCGCVAGEINRRVTGRPPSYQQRATMRPRQPDPGPPSAQRVTRAAPVHKPQPAAAVEQCDECGFYSCRCAKA